MKNKTFEINGRKIGSKMEPYVIAELSGNHNGELNRAIELIEKAHECGADAVKLQTYTAETLTIDSKASDFKIKTGLWKNRTLFELYKEAHTPWEWHEELFRRAKQLGITIFSSPFDETAVDFLEELDCPAYKIASFEIIDHALIKRAAKTGKPLIMSTGMATFKEIEEAVACAKNAGNSELLLLHCISGYPSPASEANLRTIPDLASRLKCLVGLSDHTLGTAVAVASIAMGAVAIEKHVTLRRSDGGPDAAFSLEPEELKKLVIDTRQSHSALGEATYNRTKAEQENIVFRRSLYIVADINEGEPFTPENVKCIRPGFGIAPKFLEEIMGSRASKNLRRGTALSWSMVK